MPSKSFAVQQTSQEASQMLHEPSLFRSLLQEPVKHSLWRNAQAVCDSRKGWVGASQPNNQPVPDSQIVQNHFQFVKSLKEGQASTRPNLIQEPADLSCNRNAEKVNQSDERSNVLVNLSMSGATLIITPEESSVPEEPSVSQTANQQRTGLTTNQCWALKIPNKVSN